MTAKQVKTLRKGKYLLLMAVSLAISAACAFSLMLFRIRSKEITPVSTCGGNLKTLGLSLLGYAQDYGDAFPPNLSPLFHDDDHVGYLSGRDFLCKMTTKKVAENLQEFRTGKHCDYVYTGAGLTLKKADRLGSSSVVMAYCVQPKAPSYHGRISILFADTSIRGFDEPNIKSAVDNNGLYLNGYNMPTANLNPKQPERAQTGGGK